MGASNRKNRVEQNKKGSTVLFRLKLERPFCLRITITAEVRHNLAFLTKREIYVREMSPHDITSPTYD